MVKFMRVLHQPLAGRNKRLFGVHAAAKVMPHVRLNKLHQVTSRPLTRMLMAFAALAIVEMNEAVGMICPTNSGNV